MGFIANIIYGLGSLLNSVLFIYQLIIIASAVISWVNPDPYNPIVRTLRSLTEPVYYYFRKYFPFLSYSGIDFSPLVLILLIEFLKYAVVQNIFLLATSISPQVVGF